MRWENPLTGELSQTPLPGPQPVQGWSRNDLENAASSRRSWFNSQSTKCRQLFQEHHPCFGAKYRLSKLCSLYVPGGNRWKAWATKDPKHGKLCLAGCTDSVIRGPGMGSQGWHILPPTTSCPESCTGNLLWLGGAGQGEGTHSGTRQETGSFLLQGCPDPLLNTARRTLTPTERENRHNTAIFKSEGLCTLAIATQGFRSEEVAWTPSVAHSRPEIIAKSQTARGGSLTTPRKNPPL